MQTRTWTAATCWQLLVALPLPKDECCLMEKHRGSQNVSGVQEDEEIIPAIANLDIPLVMGNRLKKTSSQYEEQRRSHGT